MDKKTQHIISKCLKGDEKAQRDLYLLYRKSWYLSSLRYAKNKFEADDILQEGLVCIFSDLHQFKGGYFKAWSTRVLVNAALRFLKKNSWQNSFVDLDQQFDIESDQIRVEDYLSMKELIKLLQELPQGYRLVFNLYVIEGYKHIEIAEQLNISIGTSKSQLSKARKMLRELVEKQLI